MKKDLTGNKKEKKVVKKRSIKENINSVPVLQKIGSKSKVKTQINKKISGLDRPVRQVTSQEKKTPKYR